MAIIIITGWLWAMVEEGRLWCIFRMVVVVDSIIEMLEIPMVVVDGIVFAWKVRF